MDESSSWRRRIRITSVDPAVRTRALVDNVMLAAWTLLAGERGRGRSRADACARTLGDPELLIRALIAKGVVHRSMTRSAGRPCFAEATELAQGLDDPWIWSQLYIEEARSAMGAGDPPRSLSGRRQGARGGDGDREPRYGRASCHWAHGWARAYRGDFHGALTELGEAIDQAAAAHDTMLQLYGASGAGIR